MMVAENRAPWQNPRILTILMLVFVAGAATGALMMRFGLHEVLHRASGLQGVFSRASVPPPAPPAPAHAINHDAVLNRFQTELGLSAPQTQKLALVLDDYSQYYQSLQEQLDDLRATGKTRIMQILDTDQRAKFEKMMTDLAPQLTNGSGASSGTPGGTPAGK
jgi:hypothetical protein